MKKHFFTTTVGFLFTLGFVAQNNVGIGTPNPNPQAILEIASNDKGVLISRLTTSARNALGNALSGAEDGMLVYDKDLTTFFYWDGPNLQWVQVGSGTGDNWGTQIVETTGSNISGNGTIASPLSVDINLDNDPNNEMELPTSAINGQIATWDGTSWTAQNPTSGADNWGTQTVVTTGTNISGNGTIGSPLSVDINLDNDPNNEIELPTSAINGQVATWNGTNWIAQNPTSGADNWGTQTVMTTGTNISGNGTGTNPLTITEVDGDITNEIQDLSLDPTTNILTITNNGNATNIDLSPYLDNTDIQNLTLTGNTLSISNGNNVTLTDNVNDADSDPNNEIELPTGGNSGQVLSTDGNGNYTWINDGAGSDNQDLSLSGNSLSLTNDGTPVDLSGYLDNTDAQNLTLTGNTLSISNGNSVTLTDNVNDADSDPDNEIELPTGGNSGQILSTDGNGNYTWINDGAGTDDQNISGSGLSGTTLTIGIEGGNNETVNLSTLKDNLGNHTATQDLDLATSKLVGNGGSIGVIIQNDGHTRIENLPQYDLSTDRRHIIADSLGNLHSVSLTELRCDLGIPTTVSDVINPTTGKTWMDRNLGASRVATSSTDELAYGDLYQWGRPTDGHQCRNSGTTNINSSNDTPSHGNFIVEPNTPNDWRTTQNNNLWQGLNGINNPCPSGYRIPTEAELNTERLSWSNNNNSGAYGSPLKLPAAGYRYRDNGSISAEGSRGYYWSSTVSGTNVRSVFSDNNNAYIYSTVRGNGHSIRCIKGN